MTSGLKLFTTKLPQLQKSLETSLSFLSLEESPNTLNIAEILLTVLWRQDVPAVIVEMYVYPLVWEVNGKQGKELFIW